MNFLIILLVICKIFEINSSQFYKPQQLRSYGVHELRTDDLPGKIGLGYNVPRCDDSFCRVVGDGIHRWASCSQFYCSCQRGQPSIQICSDGQFFDPINNICSEANKISFCQHKNFFKLGLA